MEENRERRMSMLLRRTERLREELELGAPALIIDNELRLIRSVCSELLEERDG